MITFQKSGLSDLTLERGRAFPVRRPITINQERYLTESMNPKVVDYQGTVQMIELKIDGLSKDNYDGTTNGLKTWFQASQINWAENNFTLIDELQESHTVRYWQDDFDMPETNAGLYSISVMLLEE